MESSARIELVSSSTRDTSVKSTNNDSVSQLETLGPIDRTPGIPGSDKIDYKVNVRDTRIPVTNIIIKHNHVLMDFLCRAARVQELRMLT